MNISVGHISLIEKGRRRRFLNEVGIRVSGVKQRVTPAECETEIELLDLNFATAKFVLTVIMSSERQSETNRITGSFKEELSSLHLSRAPTPSSMDMDLSSDNLNPTR